MNLVLTNPAGFWALLGIPAVILIHFLQRQAKVIPISTLFLLAQTQRESVSGRRFDRITNSIPLWLQLLIVLLLTWLLLEPRHIRPASTQQVAVVLDSSASMSVFREKLQETLASKLPDLRGTASRLELFVFESDPDKPTIYAGEDVEAASAAVAAWTPAAGSIDPSNALRLARSRINREGILIYVSDTPTEDLPFDAQLLTVGEARSNCGFTGVAFERRDDDLVWKAVVRNYSDEAQVRTWQAVFQDGSRSEPRKIEITKSGLATISSTFPSRGSRLRIVLSADDFPLDDELPIVRPAPKTLKFWTSTSQKFAAISDRFEESFPNVEPVNDSAEADLFFVSYDPLMPELPSGDSIVFVDETTQSRKYLRGGIIAEKHPLMDGLNWQALLIRESIQLELNQSDQVLLWQGKRPLIALRSTAKFEDASSGGADAPPAPVRRVRQLIMNFDPTLSNAFKLPATVVLLHRFCEDLRTRKVAPEARNTETGQPLEIATRSGPSAQPVRYTSFGPDGETIDDRVVRPEDMRDLRAPIAPGFFQVTQGEQLLFESGAHFADTREADLRKCATVDEVSTDAGQAVERNTREDRLWRLWTILGLAALVLAWYYTKNRPRNSELGTRSSEVGARSSELGARNPNHLIT
jgi:hypothetical protein